jgi:hypothetical protein
VITIRPCVAGNKSRPAQEAPGSRTRMIKATAMPATSTRARSSRPSVFNVIGRPIYPSEALKSVSLRTNQPISPLRVEEDFSAPILDGSSSFKTADIRRKCSHLDATITFVYIQNAKHRPMRHFLCASKESSARVAGYLRRL